MSVKKNNTPHGTKVVPWVTGVIVLAAAAVHFTMGPAAEGLVYDRGAIASGDIWRLISGHFIHCDLQHLLWNLAAIAILGGLLELRIGFKLVGVVLASCLGVSGWLWFMKSELNAYCGLSGMLNGMLVVLLTVLWKEHRHPLIPLIGLGSILKIVVETAWQQSLFTSLSWAAVPGAHGAGFAAGLFYLFFKAGGRWVFSGHQQTQVW